MVQLDQCGNSNETKASGNDQRSKDAKECVQALLGHRLMHIHWDVRYERRFRICAWQHCCAVLPYKVYEMCGGIAFSRLPSILTVVGHHVRRRARNIKYDHTTCQYGLRHSQQQQECVAPGVTFFVYSARTCCNLLSHALTAAHQSNFPCDLAMR